LTTTTKIFVILVCLFAFIFTPMAIQFAARVENWRTSADQFRSSATASLAREQSLKSVLDAREADWQRQFAEDQRRLNEAQQQLAELQRKNDELRQNSDQLARSREMLETQAGILTAELAVKSKHGDELADAREKALSRERELQTANAWLTDELQRARAAIDVMKQQDAQRQQQMIACRQENDDLRRSLNLGRAAEPLTSGTGSTIEPLTPPARSRITGKVKEIRGNLVSIDVGSASGVRQGMKMIVVRNGSYVGDIRITSATPGEAVGQIALLGPEGKQVRAGDMVMDEASFTAG
jgi:hypothetical protein